MARFSRLLSPLRRIDADPDDLVVQAYELLRQIPNHRGIWPAMDALASEASARIALATYLREHRD
ncbi:hypothetical protein ACIOG4_28505 [Streptomyces microflavus]|uniref:hypothetical protein n=1 Tax=Streptomyces microflavus TaxID=1919 RepID=UPI00382F35F2